VRERGMSVKGRFVIPGTHTASIAVAQNDGQKKFEVNEERIE
jgi:hypothetical protein